MLAKISLAVVALLATGVAARNVQVGKARGPPDASQSALMARYIVNEAEWTSIATISVREDTKNYPFVNLVSLSDGPKGKGTGTPYIFLTPLDFTGQDLKKDQRVTMLMSLIQGNWCDEKGYDPMDPRCARVIFSGKIKQIPESDNSLEYEIARKAFFGRHEWLSHMPANHHFYLAKLEIETIAVLAKFGGAAHVTVDEYYKASNDAVEKYALRYRK